MFTPQYHTRPSSARFNSSTPVWTTKDDDDNNNNSIQHQEQQQFHPGPRSSPVNSRSISSPSQDNPYKKKRPLDFEPEFFAALDSSLQEHDKDWDRPACPALTRSESPTGHDHRPVKRARKPTYSGHFFPAASGVRIRPDGDTISSSAASAASAASTASTASSSSSTTALGSASSLSTAATFDKSAFSTTVQAAGNDAATHTSTAPASPNTTSSGHLHTLPSSLRYSSGPSIIDLSSGEELVALHIGENEHKRRRDSFSEYIGHSPPDVSSSVYETPPYSYSDSSSTTSNKPYTSQQQRSQQRREQEEEHEQDQEQEQEYEQEHEQEQRQKQSETVDDGFIMSFLDPQFSISKPSPSKRLRLGPSSHSRHHHLMFLSETDCEQDHAGGTVINVNHDCRGHECHHGVGPIYSSANGTGSRNRSKNKRGRTHQVSSQSRGFNPTWDHIDLNGIATRWHGTTGGAGSGFGARSNDDGTDRVECDNVDVDSEQDIKADSSAGMDIGLDDHRIESGALVRYQDGKEQGQDRGRLEFVDGLFNTLGWPQFPKVLKAEGHEMVLFKQPDLLCANAQEAHSQCGAWEEAFREKMTPAVATSKEGEEGGYEDEYYDIGQGEFGYWEEASHPYSSVCIEELSDDEDEGNLADDEGGDRRRISTADDSDEVPLAELEEAVMDMDLD
ncbi:hypothetical protein BGZ94_004009 [Podila epigama]|nr:hypothetical protein BGZ94_004009 [Podila epigama]